MLKMFSVYDKKIGSHGTPFVAKTNGEAMRIFGDAVSDPNVIFSKHPEDFSLYNVGSFDEISGEFTTTKPLHISEAVDFLNNKEG